MDRSAQMHMLVDILWEWFERHKRELPWRDMKIENDSERAYRVMVSEIMLQQTQVSRVKIVFKDFLDRFPTLFDLANASNKDVIMAWRGMGYNSRALRLRDAAKYVVIHCNGVFPHEYEQLLSINGIGPYTAAAIRNFAYNIPTPCIDTNIRRIYHRTFIGPENEDGSWETSDKELVKIAEDILQIAIDRTDEHTAANWHAALMDYGSLVQTKNNPKWDICVLSNYGIMKTTASNWVPPVRGAAKERLKKEPGRMEGVHYVPNRIFRGRIVEALRDHQSGLTDIEIGTLVCNDWNEGEHKKWLQKLINKLVQERMIELHDGRHVLAG